MMLKIQELVTEVLDYLTFWMMAYQMYLYNGSIVLTLLLVGVVQIVRCSIVAKFLNIGSTIDASQPDMVNREKLKEEIEEHYWDSIFYLIAVNLSVITLFKFLSA